MMEQGPQGSDGRRVRTDRAKPIMTPTGSFKASQRDTWRTSGASGGTGAVLSHLRFMWGMMASIPPQVHAADPGGPGEGDRRSRRPVGSVGYPEPESATFLGLTGDRCTAGSVRKARASRPSPRRHWSREGGGWGRSVDPRAGTTRQSARCRFGDVDAHVAGPDDRRTDPPSARNEPPRGWGSCTTMTPRGRTNDRSRASSSRAEGGSP